MTDRTLWALASLILALATASQASAAHSTRDLFVETAPGVRIHVIQAGAATSRPAVVLIPGWRLTANIWREQIAAFSKSGRVIAIDPRSQGASTKTADGDTPEERARDLRAVLGQLKAGPVVLVGWSQGVQDVAAYVDQFGVAGVKGVVLVDSTISSGAQGVATAPAEAARELARLSQFVHYPREATEGMMRAIIRRPLGKAELDALIADALKTPDAIGAAMLADDLLGPDRTPAIAKFDVPTLVIASENSPELDAQRAMAAKLPHGRFVVAANAGHAVFVDQPERFDALLDGFLSEVR